MTPKSFQKRKDYAEQMVALAEYMDVDHMTLGDFNRGIDCMSVAYEQSLPELPGIAGLAMRNLSEKPPMIKKLYCEALKALKRHMQKWEKM